MCLHMCWSVPALVRLDLTAALSFAIRPQHDVAGEQRWESTPSWHLAHAQGAHLVHFMTEQVLNDFALLL